MIGINRMNVAPLILLLCLLLSSNTTHAQQEKKITIKEALSLAKKNYPAIKAAKLNVIKQNKLKSSAIDLGMTSITTGQDDVKDGNKGGVTTFGISQSDIDIFGILSKNKFQNSEINVAKAEYKLTEANVKLYVRKAFNNLLEIEDLLSVYMKIDSVYKNFVSSAELRYSTGETSKLALLSAMTKYDKLKLQVKKLIGEKAIAKSNLNQYLLIKEPFVIVDSIEIFDISINSFENNSDMLLMQEKLNRSEKEWKMQRAAILPKLSVLYQNRKVSGVSGYYSYEAGISIPLFNGTRSKTRAAKTQMLIEKENMNTKMISLKTELSQKLIALDYLQELRDYYIEHALPLSLEQINASKLAYRLGDINYLQFIESIESSLKINLDYINTNSQYRNAKAELMKLIGK